MPTLVPPGWSIDSFRDKPIAQDVAYEDAAELGEVTREIRRLPPLVTSWEVERLRELLADAEEGKRFVLQGGDCAETTSETRASIIVNKLKILLQMSLVLVHGSKKPVIRVGRFAGQYAKPRSSPTETRTVGGNPIGWSRILVQRLNLQLEPSGAPVRLGREVDNVNAEEPALYAKDGQVAVFWTEGQEIYICGGCFPDNSLHLVWIDPTDLVPSSAPLVVPPLAGGITDEQAAFLGDSILVTADLRFHVHSEPGSLALRCR